MMDGEILFTDTTRFKTIKGLVDADLTDRSPWFRRGGQEPHRAFQYLCLTPDSETFVVFFFCSNLFRVRRFLGVGEAMMGVFCSQLQI